MKKAKKKRARMKRREVPLYWYRWYGHVYHVVNRGTGRTLCGINVLRGRNFDGLVESRPAGYPFLPRQASGARSMDRHLCRRCRDAEWRADGVVVK